MHDLLVVLRQLPALFAVLADMLHTVVAYIEPHTKVFRAQHIVEIGNLGELLGHQSAIKGIETPHTTILLLEVSLHKVHIGSQIIEQGSGKGAAEHGNPDIGILCRQCPHHGDGHCHIAQCGEPYDQYMLLPH